MDTSSSTPPSPPPPPTNNSILMGPSSSSNSSSNDGVLPTVNPIPTKSKSTSPTVPLAELPRMAITTTTTSKSVTNSSSAPIGMHNIGQIRLLTGHRPSSQISHSSSTSTSSSMTVGQQVSSARTPAHSFDSGSAIPLGQQQQSTAAAMLTTTSNPFLPFHSITRVNLQFLVLGAESVGKTSILSRLQNQCSPIAYQRSTGPDLHRLKCGQIEAIDIGGQSSCLRIAQAYSDLVNTFVLVYDITSAESFLYARYWLDYLHCKKRAITTGAPSSGSNSNSSSTISLNRSPLSTTSSAHTPPTILLIGNKKDLESERKVSRNLARNLALVHNAEYIELSARYDLSLETILDQLENRVKQQQQMAAPEELH